MAIPFSCKHRWALRCGSSPIRSEGDAMANSIGEEDHSNFVHRRVVLSPMEEGGIVEGALDGREAVTSKGKAMTMSDSVNGSISGVFGGIRRSDKLGDK